jgi:hypothetical protein
LRFKYCAQAPLSRAELTPFAKLHGIFDTWLGSSIVLCSAALMSATLQLLQATLPLLCPRSSQCYTQAFPACPTSGDNTCPPNKMAFFCVASGQLANYSAKNYTNSYRLELPFNASECKYVLVYAAVNASE